MTTYPPNMSLRPLEKWPRATERTERPRSPFKAGWSDTIGVLMTELRQLGNNPRGPAWSLASFPPSTLQVAIEERHFRVDGMPRASAVPTHPGVILNIESKHGPLSCPCDKFDRWTDNLRAIALGLRALRSLDRYGITPGAEQYTGWKALPASGSSGAPSVVTAADAEQFLRSLVSVEGDGLDLGTLPQAYRRAARAAHPDRGGDRTVWDAVEHAATILRTTGAL